jgi:hypothetical protein
VRRRAGAQDRGERAGDGHRAEEVGLELPPYVGHVAVEEVRHDRGTGVVDQKGHVAGHPRRLGHRGRIGDVEGQRGRPGVGDRPGVAGGGVDLRGAAGERLVHEGTAQATVGAGHEYHRVFDLHDPSSC